MKDVIDDHEEKEPAEWVGKIKEFGKNADDVDKKDSEDVKIRKNGDEKPDIKAQDIKTKIETFS